MIRARGPAHGGMNEYTLWFAVMALGLHCLEEFALRLPVWTEKVLKMSFLWTEFYVINAFYLIFIVGTALVGWRVPIIALSTPGQLLFNSVFMHLLTSVLTWSYSPGTLTAIVFYLPTALYIYRGARRDGVFTWGRFLGAMGIAVLLQAYPVLLFLMNRYLGAS